MFVKHLGGASAGVFVAAEEELLAILA